MFLAVFAKGALQAIQSRLIRRAQTHCLLEMRHSRVRLTSGQVLRSEPRLCHGIGRIDLDRALISLERARICPALSCARYPGPTMPPKNPAGATQLP